MLMPTSAPRQRPPLQVMTLDRQILTEIKVADTWLSRLRGLLGSAALLPRQGLLLSPCNSIHTAAMQYALDVVFLAQDGTILKLVTQLPPWRGAVCWRARSTLELGAGTAAELGLAIGQRLTVTPIPNWPGYVAVCRTEGQA